MTTNRTAEPNAMPSDDLLVDVHRTVVPVDARTAFAPIRRIGGDVGWYSGDALWTLRGIVDALLGGPGMRRRRRDPDELRVGDRVDCWRVEAYEPNAFLRLHAEMRLPGDAWLELRVTALPDGGSEIEQISSFSPSGALGKVYWYAVHPLHTRIFAGMLRGIANAARRAASAP